MDRFCATPWCIALFRQVIAVKGSSLFLTGNPGSGKSQKKRHFLKYFAPFETVIDWDTGKDDLQLMFTLGKPIRILIPYGCKMELRGEPPVPVQVVPVPTPELFFDMIEPGSINVISLRNYFLDEKNLKRYVRQMFKSFLLKLRLNRFKAWLPAVMAVDEAHVILGNLRIDKSTEAMQTGQDAANILKECRSKGLRWLIVSQGFYDLQGTARENIQCYIVCRGTIVEKRDHPVLNYLSGFARSCETKEGWIVLPNGDYYGKNGPIPFPYYEPAKVRIIYRGFVDEEKDLPDEEMTGIDQGIYSQFMKAEEPEQAIPSRYEVIEDES